MDSIVAAQPEVFGIAAGASGALLVNPNRRQLRVELLKGHECLPMLLLAETMQAPGSRQGGSSL